jgi:Na+-driven multidrug efflux pump
MLTSFKYLVGVWVLFIILVIYMQIKRVYSPFQKKGEFDFNSDVILQMLAFGLSVILSAVLVVAAGIEYSSS